MDEKNEWDIMREESKEKKERNKIQSLNLLLRAGVRWHKFSETHYRIGEFDFWPTTGKFFNRDTKRTGRGVFNLLKELKK